MIELTFLVGIGTFCLSVYLLNRRQRVAVRRKREREAMIRRLREAA